MRQVRRPDADSISDSGAYIYIHSILNQKLQAIQVLSNCSPREAAQSALHCRQSLTLLTADGQDHEGLCTMTSMATSRIRWVNLQQCMNRQRKLVPGGLSCGFAHVEMAASNGLFSWTICWIESSRDRTSESTHVRLPPQNVCTVSRLTQP